MSPLLMSVQDNATTASTTAPKGTEIIETDLFIIGAGPAGASLACFLGSYGMTFRYKREIKAKTEQD
jgi:ribulose 1,5-bisphosphate synthetase/thiazole synthase